MILCLMIIFSVVLFNLNYEDPKVISETIKPCEDHCYQCTGNCDEFIEYCLWECDALEEISSEYYSHQILREWETMSITLYELGKFTAINWKTKKAYKFEDLVLTYNETTCHPFTGAITSTYMIFGDADKGCVKIRYSLENYRNKIDERLELRCNCARTLIVVTLEDVHGE